jgi:hypothetical protein
MDPLVQFLFKIWEQLKLRLRLYSVVDSDNFTLATFRRNILPKTSEYAIEPAGVTNYSTTLLIFTTVKTYSVACESSSEITSATLLLKCFVRVF